VPTSESINNKSITYRERKNKRERERKREEEECLRVATALLFIN